MKPLIALLVLASIASLSPIALAQDDVSKKYIELLEKNAKLMEEIQTLRKENQTLEAKIKELQSSPGDKLGTAEKEKKTVAALGTKWKGTYTGKGGVSYSADAEVVARDGKTMTLRTSTENGAIMEYECEFTTSDKYKIKSTRRIQASRGNANPPPVGGVNGVGKISNDRLIQEFSMKRAGEPDYLQRFDLKLQN